jgi:Mg2+ and Co2+ transporters
MLRDLGMAFNLHPLALEDVFHAHQRSKLDLYEGQGFIVLNDPTYEDCELHPRQVSIFFGENYAISFHDHKLDIFKPVRDRLQTAGSRLRTFGIDYLVYALIDLVVDRKFPLIEALSSHLEELEDEALGHPTEDTLNHIHQARRRWWRSTGSNGPSARRAGGDAAGSAVHHARDAHLPARLLRPFGGRARPGRELPRNDQRPDGSLPHACPTACPR